jgi:hypothetical protein
MVVVAGGRGSNPALAAVRIRARLAIKFGSGHKSSPAQSCRSPSSTRVRTQLLEPQHSICPSSGARPGAPDKEIGLRCFRQADCLSFCLTTVLPRRGSPWTAGRLRRLGGCATARTLS